MSDSSSNKAAIGVLRAVDAAFTTDAPKFQGPFVAAGVFRGAKPGYIFQSGPDGLGYYVDKSGVFAAQLQQSASVSTAAITQKDAAQLLEEAEQLAADLKDLENIDERGIKRIVAGLERRVRKNQELRMKYSDTADKFMESELELHEILQKLLALAGEAELYGQLQAHASIPLILTLLHHENVDIVCTAVDLLQELTDADVVADLTEESEQLVETMIEASAIDLLVQRLLTLKEKASEEEETAVFGILTCFQNMIEIDENVAELLIAKSELVKWLLQRLNPRTHRQFTANKAAAAELLAIAVQVREANRLTLMSQGGINAVLVAVEPYRKLKADLGEQEEEEYVHTLCDVLAACLLHAGVKEQFLEDQGVELMLLILRTKRTFRLAALKVLNYATTDYGKAVERVIDAKGINTLFGIFMGKTKVKGVKPGTDAAKQETEHVVSLLANMFQHVASRTKRDRIAAKFVESEFEKCDRMMEIFFQYERRLAAAVARLEESGETDEDVVESTKAGAGQFVLQQICVIFGHLWSTGDALLKRRLLLLLHQKSVGLAAVREHLQDMHAAVEDGEDKDKASILRNKLAKLIVALGGVVEVKPAAADDQPPQPPPPAAVVAEEAPVANGDVSGGATSNGAHSDAPVEKLPRKRVRISEAADDDERETQRPRAPHAAPSSSHASEGDGERAPRESRKDEPEEGGRGRRDAAAEGSRARQGDQDGEARNGGRERDERTEDKGGPREGRGKEGHHERREDGRSRDADRGKDRGRAHRDRDGERDRERERARDKERERGRSARDGRSQGDDYDRRSSRHSDRRGD